MVQGSPEVDAKQEDIDNAAARLPVTHLVLCVHGIGQNLTAANIAGEPLCAAPSQVSGCALENDYVKQTCYHSYIWLT